MPHITTDPNNALCPNYTLQENAELREPLVEDGSMDAQDAHHLTAIWHKQYDINCQQCNTQVAANTAKDNIQREQHQQEKERLKEEVEKERVEAEKEEWKKNKTKYTPIPN